MQQFRAKMSADAWVDSPNLRALTGARAPLGFHSLLLASWPIQMVTSRAVQVAVHGGRVGWQGK